MFIFLYKYHGVSTTKNERELSTGVSRWCLVIIYVFSLFYINFDIENGKELIIIHAWRVAPSLCIYRVF